MKILFTKSSLPLSKLIRWGFNEPTSHVAIMFDNKLVFQSNLLGVGLEGIYRFQAAAEIVFTIDVPMNLKSEEQIYQNLLSQYDGKSYDFKAFAYFGYRVILKKLFGKPMPDKNSWQRPDAFLCDGLLAALQDPCLPAWLQKAISGLGDIEMKSPYQVYLAISEAAKTASAQND